jgi:hypothetical protein
MRRRQEENISVLGYDLSSNAGLEDFTVKPDGRKRRRGKQVVDQTNGFQSMNETVFLCNDVVVPARETVAGEAFMRVSTSNMSFTLSVMGMRSPRQDTQREGQKEEGEIHFRRRQRDRSSRYMTYREGGWDS